MDKKQKKISVLIPALNEEKNIANVINCIKKIDIVDEIIVIDNNSTDNSKEILEKDSRFHFIEANENGGFAKGNNIGKYTGYYYTASMFAQIITPVFSGFIMDQLGTMRVLFPYSVVFCILALITMIQVKHGDSKPIAVKNIEAFDE